MAQLQELIQKANAIEAKGAYAEAALLRQQILAIVEKALGPEHPDTATSLNNLAGLYLAQTNAPAAEPLLQRLTRAQADWLRRELPLQPREFRSSLIDQQPDAPANTFALLDLSPAAAPLALETRLNRQGLLAEIERRQALLKASSPETRQLADQLAGLDRQLASLTLPPSQREPLRQRRQELENQLYRLFPALRIEGVSTAQVAAALRSAAPQGLLVEFQKYRPYGKGAKGQVEWGAERYVALLLRPDGTIRAIPLGEAAPIDAAVSEAVIASRTANQQAEAPERLAAVSRLVLTPLQKELSGVTELFLSPDGELNRLPLAALPLATSDGPTLGESVRLRLLTTGRELVRLIQPVKGGAAPVLVANPDFNAAGGPPSRPPAPVSAMGGGSTRSPDLGSAQPWEPLEGTQREASQLAPLLRLRPEAVISGPRATAALVLRQKAPRILHIATHGFFLDPPQALPGSGAVLTSRAPAGVVGLPLPDDPLQRSGLVFAGANRPTANPADDGYLTAAEATAMDLEGTELVTLSACETGRGGVRGGEGVYGLQRALAVAGARSTLLSLWKVDDTMTAVFMAHYYNLLNAGKGRAEALRQSQAFFRDNKSSSYHDIRVWGAFQLSGDWRPLPRW